MLTNAVKHGSRDEPVFVERHWPDGSFAGELRIEVRNTVGASRVRRRTARVSTACATGSSRRVAGSTCGAGRRMRA